MSGRALLIGDAALATSALLRAFGLDTVIVAGEEQAIAQLDRESFDFVGFAGPLSGSLAEAAARHPSVRVVDLGRSFPPGLNSTAPIPLEPLIENAPLAIAVVSPNQRIELSNPLFSDLARRLGRLPFQANQSLSIDELFPELRSVIDQAREDMKPLSEGVIELSSDSYRGVFKRMASLIPSLAGDEKYVAIFLSEITEEVRTAKEAESLARLSAGLSSVLTSMTDGVWLYEESGTVIDVNPAVLNLFGLSSRQEAISYGSFLSFDLRDAEGKPVPPEGLPHVLALEGKVIPDYMATGRHLLTGHDIDLSIAAAPIHGDHGISGAVVVIRDITALQELDRKKDEFLSVASHELRTPLTTIKGYTQLLAQTGNQISPAERATFLDASLGEIERMMRLISELLDVSKIETNRFQLHPQPLEWVSFLAGLAAAFQVQNPGRAITYSHALDELTLTVDSDRMRQVVDNLLSNAIKYSDARSEIFVRTSVSGNAAVTVVEDRGIGIPRDELPFVFERFRRARNVSSRHYVGLGLGLYISKAIIEAHGGTITIESEEGRGSAFTITVPLPPASGG